MRGVIPFNAQCRQALLWAKEAALRARETAISAQDLHDAVHRVLPREDNVWQMIERPEGVSFVNKVTGELQTFTKGT